MRVNKDLSPIEKAALALWMLYQCDLSTRQVADLLGVSRQAAWRMMSCMSRVVPIVLINGRWVLLREEIGSDEI